MNIHHCRQFIPRVTDWIYDEFIQGHIPNCSRDNIRSALSNRGVKELPITLVCLEGSRCVGTASLFLNDLSKLDKLTPWLAALYVDMEYRGRGIGKLLTSEIEDLAQKRGYSSIYLRTENTGEYYSRLGWNHKLDIVDENKIETSVYEKAIKK